MLSVCLSVSGQGGREVPEKSGLETFDEGRHLCAGQGNGLDSEIPLHHGVWREKAVPKSYSLNFCSLKVFFLNLLLFLYLGAGGCCLFL